MKLINLSLTDKGIFCEISHDAQAFIGNVFPVTFKVCGIMDESDVSYSVELTPGTWAGYPNYRDLRGMVYSKDGILLKEVKYSYEVEDMVLYEFWDYFCRLNSTSIGLVVGSGNGTWGEWIDGVNRNKITCHLVEGSDYEFQKLTANYEGSSHAILHNKILSPDGEDYKFWEIGGGFSSTNLDYLLKNNINPDKPKIVKTTEINKFLKEIGHVDWIRFDVEGMDYDLIMATNPSKFESMKMVQYEHMNLEDNKKEEISKLFLSLGFKKLSFGIDTVFIKNP